jgi:hypothetical protein
MSDLRDLLERESERVALADDAASRLWERRRSNERRRRVSGFVVGASLAVVVVALAIRATGLFSDERPHIPATPAAPYEEIAGTYETRLPAAMTVDGQPVQGRYELRLLPSGSLLLSVPSDFEQAVGSVTFRLSGNLFTTNAFANYLCPGTVGIYRWSLDGDALRFVPLDEPCAIRGAVFSTRPWRII